MTLSIVLLTCNQCTHTMRLMESLKPYLTSRPDTDVVIVDNGSSDNTQAALAKWLKENSHIAPRISIIPLDCNHGVAGGRNIGLKAAQGQLLLILDNDTVINSEALDGLRNHLIDNPKCGICAPALRSPEGELQSSAKPYPGLWLKIAHVLRPGKELKLEHAEMLKAHPWYVIGACQMLRHSTFEAVGPLDSGIFYGPEDADYCARVRKAGFTIDYLPQYTIIHDWRRVTRRAPFSSLARRHALALIRFWLHHPSSKH